MIALRIRVARLERRLSVAELAAAASLSYAELRSIEAGESSISAAALYLLARALAIPVDVLFIELEQPRQARRRARLPSPPED